MPRWLVFSGVDVTLNPQSGLARCLTVLIIGAISAAVVPMSPAAAAGGTQQAIRATAMFAGGCFWCMEPPFDQLAGVLSTTSGYAGGRVKNPTYEQVSRGGTGHAEVVQVTYDPAKITFQQLLETFWRNVDPFDGGGQFCDRGDQYRAAVFYASEDEKRLADASRQKVQEQLGRTVVTAIMPAATFYAAEDYHQDYYKKNPLQYKFYSWNCGRAQRLETLWKK
jgi:peptide-methionine (S)-S-oxide reductase